jgi:hypothetical protein
MNPRDENVMINKLIKEVFAAGVLAPFLLLAFASITRRLPRDRDRGPGCRRGDECQSENERVVAIRQPNVATEHVT